ncbi:unnamed protein product [Linum tenue]|uniref:SAM domain-containing protein n=1 Tax=Linum tenue TaxID=586396 RepID=A0AAV0KWL4_9ROSI|nr:unnamed protein product [Linum tenue]
MYADRVEASEKMSVKERLNGNSVGDSSRRRQVTGKRIDARDLRLKLQKKSQAPQTGRGGIRDLREKLSGIMNPQLVNSDPPKPKQAATKPARRGVAAEVPELEIKKVASVATKKKSQQKKDTSVDSFLESLGLEKYQITFQAEEVDMTALVHMNDDDLKALGIPMGPRKKILLALESRG